MSGDQVNSENMMDVAGKFSLKHFPSSMAPNRDVEGNADECYRLELLFASIKKQKVVLKMIGNSVTSRTI